MQTIYKYPLRIVDEQSIELPRGAVVLHVGDDPLGTLCVWCRVELDQPPHTAIFFVVGTGQPVPAAAKRHCGSVVKGAYVWHVYTTGA